jgi:DNA-binding FadR family transcriptional regulator
LGSARVKDPTRAVLGLCRCEQGHVTVKKAEIVADQIAQTIVGQRWEPGDLFGSEVELIARYGVSRAVFREAVRLLEHHGLAEMRRGLHGGLFVRQPDPKPVARAMAVYLDRSYGQFGRLFCV